MRSQTLSLFVCLFSAALASAQIVPKSSHVWIINEENHGYDDVAGNSQMPYYNQLISQYGSAIQFYSDQHSSLPALMWFVAGAAVEPNNDTISCQHSQDNVVREILKKGYKWRAYQENLPSPGFQGLYSPDQLYYRRHNPLIDFTDVCPGTGQDTNSVPLTQMATDFSTIGTVNFAWVTPNVNDNAHNGTLQQADQWLQANLPAILARPEFAPGGDGILFIVWDESDLTDDTSCSATVSVGCGGHTSALVLGPQVIPGYRSAVTYHNENVLATVCAAMGLSACPGAAQTAAPMADFFYPSAAAAAVPKNSIRIAMPENESTVIGAVHLMALASESLTVSQTQVWDNGVRLGVYGAQIDATYNLAPGNHTTTVLDLDTNYNVIHESSVAYTVEASESGIQIVSPTPNETTVSPVRIAVQANEPLPVGQIEVWDNGVKLGYYGSANVNQYYTFAPGTHTSTFFDLDALGNTLHQSSVTYNVAAPVNGVQIISPISGASLSNPTIQVVAQAVESVAVNQMQVWDNGVKLSWSAGSLVKQEFTVAPGSHALTVLDLDNHGNVLHQSSITYTVPGAIPYGVQIVAPTLAQAVGNSTVQVAAQATEAVPVSQMQVWDNGVKLGWYPGTVVNQSFSLAPGPHTVTVFDLDNNFNILHLSSISYFMQ